MQDGNGCVYVADHGNQRAQKFCPCGPTETPTQTPTQTMTSTKTVTVTETMTVTITPSATPTLALYPQGDILVFPNPAGINSGGHVKFINLPRAATVLIYTISGEFVTFLNPDASEAVWELRNVYGNRVSPGSYYYIVKWDENRGMVTGKIFLTN